MLVQETVTLKRGVEPSRKFAIQYPHERRVFCSGVLEMPSNNNYNIGGALESERNKINLLLRDMNGALFTQKSGSKDTILGPEPSSSDAAAFVLLVFLNQLPYFARHLTYLHQLRQFYEVWWRKRNPRSPPVCVERWSLKGKIKFIFSRILYECEWLASLFFASFVILLVAGFAVILAGLMGPGYTHGNN
eukprot:Trichotokara_eunicae@DN5467_c0_g1_i1.p1